MTRPVRLLVADREPMRRGVRLVLDGVVDICAEAQNAEQAIRAAMREQPDLCLVAESLQGGGPNAVRGICRSAPNTAVVVLAENGDVESLLESVRAGAVGYVPGPLDAARLRRVVYAVAANEAIVPRSMVLELLIELRNGGNRDDNLSPRESQVLRMLRRGQTTAQIADRLEIAPVTVRRHISDIVRKLGVENRAALRS